MYVCTYIYIYIYMCVETNLYVSECLCRGLTRSDSVAGLACTVTGCAFSFEEENPGVS